MHSTLSDPALLAIASGGAVVLLLVLTDIFVTLFAYDGFTFLAPRVHRVLWAVMRESTRVLPRRLRPGALSLASAFLLPATLVFWLALETAGFAMIYMPGLASGAFAIAHRAGDGAQSAFYLSGGDLTSLTFGDLTPHTAFYRAMVDVETMIGLATFTLALTYVLSAFDALAKLHSMYSRVRRNAIEPNRPSTIIERRYRDGDASYYSDFLHDAVQDLVAYDDGLRRFPVAFYFHTRQKERATPTILSALGELIELSHWGLPSSEPVTRDPNLLALVDEYRSMLLRLQGYFLPRVVVPSRAVADTGHFRAEAASDEWELAAFTRLREEARRASGIEDTGSTEDIARQFCDWVQFHRMTTTVLAGLATVLGYRVES